MNRLDDRIREALKEEDRSIIDDTEELGYFALGTGIFRGKLGWVAWVVMIVQATLFLGGLWCAVRFFAATDVLPALKYGLSGAVLILAATVLKLSLMPQMQANRILREMKRIELMLAARPNQTGGPAK